MGVVEEYLMFGDSNRTVGARIMRRVKIFTRKTVILDSLSLIIIIISFPNCMCNTASLHNAFMGSPLL